MPIWPAFDPVSNSTGVNQNQPINSSKCVVKCGRAVDPGGITTLYRSLVKKAGVPTIRFHDLRHTHATTLLSCGVHPKVVAERLGHSTVKLTMDVYSHVLPGLQDDCARKVDKVLRAALEAQPTVKKTG